MCHSSMSAFEQHLQKNLGALIAKAVKPAEDADRDANAKLLAKLEQQLEALMVLTRSAEDHEATSKHALAETRKLEASLMEREASVAARESAVEEKVLLVALEWLSCGLCGLCFALNFHNVARNVPRLYYCCDLSGYLYMRSGAFS